MPNEALHVLFVCSRNQWRSPTAEHLWRRDPRVKVRSGGTSPRARHRVSANDIDWADLVLVMEHSHQRRLVAEFGHGLAGKAVHVLDIPDAYRYMDPELIEQLQAAVDPLLGAA